MRRFFALVVSVSAVALSLVGCGSDSDSSSNNGGSGGNPLAQCVGINAEFTPAEFHAQTEAGKACSGTSDVDSVCANDLPVIGGQCGKGCLGMGDDAAQAVCVSGCIQDELTKAHSAPLSQECMACYTSDVECARKKCLFDCATDPTLPGCLTCRINNGCVAAFYGCSGLPVPGTSDGGGGEGGA